MLNHRFDTIFVETFVSGMPNPIANSARGPGLLPFISFLLPVLFAPLGARLVISLATSIIVAGRLLRWFKLDEAIVVANVPCKHSESISPITVVVIVEEILATLINVSRNFAIDPFLESFLEAEALRGMIRYWDTVGLRGCE